MVKRSGTQDTFGMNTGFILPNVNAVEFQPEGGSIFSDQAIELKKTHFAEVPYCFYGFSETVFGSLSYKRYCPYRKILKQLMLLVIVKPYPISERLVDI
jgi:hypothetical protein